jgi:hypothetical protein
MLPKRGASVLFEPAEIWTPLLIGLYDELKIINAIIISSI